MGVSNMTQETKRTPTPWNISNPIGYEIHIQADGKEKIAVVTDRHTEYEANAAFIVKAVNLHDELVEFVSKIASSVMVSENWAIEASNLVSRAQGAAWQLNTRQHRGMFSVI